MNLWNVSTDVFDKELIPFNGNKYLIGNGYFGIRGTMEEYTKENMCAINLSGIYDRVGDSWRESVNAPNPLLTYIVINGVKYALPESTPKSHIQTLDFKGAIHTRETVWETPSGDVKVRCERFASMDCHNIVGMKYSVTADFDCEAEIVTGVDGDVWDINGPHFAELKIDGNSVCGTTGENNIAVKTEQAVTVDFDAERTVKCGDMSVMEHITFKAEAGREYSVEKLAAVTTSSDEKPFALDIKEMDYAYCRAAHIAKWNEIWNMSEVTIDGDDEAMMALNYSIYHLNCIAPRNVSSRSIAARGLSGQVYKGAIFWDTEMFMLDYFIHTDPEVAKTLIRYRIDTIDGARTKAKEYGLNGAYYAWESQEGGYEACSDFNVVDVFTKRPMRTHFRDKQYHVSAAVVYGIFKYINATGDTTLFEQGGAETVIECARMYRSLLIKRADSELYEIHDVVGPDEYHERVNNNAYTNRMAKLVFETAVSSIDTLQSEYADCYTELDSKYGLQKLREDFVDSAENIYIPQPNEDGVIEQFDGYFGLEDASIDTVRSRILDPKEYWGGAYGVASGTQVLKQADVVAMLGIFSDEYDSEILRKNWEYYEPRTEHGSSLSACMYSLLACRNKNADEAYPFFVKSATADLRTGGKEWAGLVYIGGTHPASEGGAWIVAVKGFAGVSEENGKLVCKPCLPSKWNGMSFKLKFMSKTYRVKVDKSGGEVTEI